MQLQMGGCFVRIIIVGNAARIGGAEEAVGGRRGECKEKRVRSWGLT